MIQRAFQEVSIIRKGLVNQAPGHRIEKEGSYLWQIITLNIKEYFKWIAISDRGMSDTFIWPVVSESINSEIYINQCLRKRLFPFIRKHL